jgi:retinol dehydrogenase-14
MSEKAMKDKTCLITGGTSGVGRSIAMGCATAGASVVITSRDRARGEQAAKAIRESSGNPRVEALQADISSLESVRALVRAFRAGHSALHLLSLNAAALPLARDITQDGYERVFATSYLGHFALATLLEDLLRASAPSRVIAVVGQPSAIAGERLDFDDLMLERGFNPLKATLRAALAKTLFILEFARRLEGSGVTANAFHPGIVRSSLPRSLPWILRIPASVLMRLAGTESATGVYLATSPEIEGVTGRFFVGRRPLEFRSRHDLTGDAVRLWEASAALVGKPSP